MNRGTQNRGGRGHGGDEGFSLVELLIVCVILPFVLSAAYLVFVTLSGNYSSIAAQSEATSEAQRALDVLVREVRQGREITRGGGAVETAQPGRCSFYADIDRDNVPERITYYVDGTDLYRMVAVAQNPVYPYNFQDGVAERVVNLTTSSGVVFTYYEQATPSTPSSSPVTSQITAIGVHLSASRPSQNGQVAVDFTTKVKIRAMFSSLS